MPFPARNTPAHPPPVERFNEPTVLYVTVCARDRVNLFANAQSHAAIVSSWNQARSWRVGHYTLMPDHIHLFCVPGMWPAEPVRVWAGYWKRLASRQDPRLVGQWLRDVWDTQMRTADHYREKRSYMQMNPVRAGLVSRAEDWLFSGTVHPIVW